MRYFTRNLLIKTYFVFLDDMCTFMSQKKLQSKFDNNTHSDVFIGYCNNTNEYKIFDLTYNKIVTARTVESVKSINLFYYIRIKNSIHT